ncbi:MAG: hypothetical protein ACETVZ_00190 [Phycisphaerae bacterium]
METSIQIIKEIQKDAADLQRKFLTLPGEPSADVSSEQYQAIDNAQNGLRGWRNWDLGQLEKAFSKES